MLGCGAGAFGVHVAEPTVSKSMLIAALLAARVGISLASMQQDSQHGEEGAPIAVPQRDRDAVKGVLVELMCTVPGPLRAQLSDALAVIAQQEYPDKWPTLLKELDERMHHANDLDVIVGVLETANAIFKWFRTQVECDPVNYVLRHAVDDFAMPLLHMFHRLSSWVDERTPAGAAAAAELEKALSAVRLILRCVYSLSWVTIPDKIEDNREQWMAGMHKFLTYRNAALIDPEEEDRPGPLERVYAAICQNLALFVEKYDEEFEEFVKDFVGAVADLLAETASAASAESASGGGARAGAAAPKFDVVVSSAMRFLSHVVGKPMFKELFADEQTQRSLCENVVIPNMLLREVDEDLFDENPVEYIRRDIEGSDADTRRRTAADLLRGLTKYFEESVGGIVLRAANGMLEASRADRESGWRQKETAISLMAALAERASTRVYGVTAISPTIDLADFMERFILPELQGPAEAAARGDRGAHDTLSQYPILKATCIRFLAHFRSQLTQAQLESVIPIVTPYLHASNYVVHTYAAACFERFLTVRDGGMAPTPGNTEVSVTTVPIGPAATPMAAIRPRLSRQAVTRVMADVAEALVNRMNDPHYRENEYLMKCLMRLVSFVQEDVMPLTGPILSGVTEVLTRVARNPSNPIFNHFLFETLAILMRHTCKAKPETVHDFESHMFPPFEQILSANVAEFLPYVFQLMAQLLELHPVPDPSQGRPHSLSDAYQSLFPPLLTPTLWETRANVPALAVLVRSYVRRGSSWLVEQGHVDRLLTIFQKIVARKPTEEHGFVIGNAFVEELDSSTLSRWWDNMSQVLLTRLQQDPSVRLLRRVIYFFMLLSGKHGGRAYEAALDSLESQLSKQILHQLICPNLNKVLGKRNRKVVAVGAIRLLSDVDSLWADERGVNLWKSLLTSVVQVFEAQQDTSVGEVEAQEESHEIWAAEVSERREEYAATYSRLSFATSSAERDPFPDIREPRALLAECLQGIARTRAEELAGAVRATSVADVVQAYCQQAGVRIA